MPETQQLKVFLCHASEDKPEVRELYRRLNAEGWIDVWLDEMKILPGQEWDLEIEKAVEDANVVVVCISSRSVEKEGYIQSQLRTVLNVAEEKPEGAIFVIPLKLDNCETPRRLKIWQWVDYFPSSQLDWAYQRLLESFKQRAKTLTIPTQKASEAIQAEQNPAPVTAPSANLPSDTKTLDISTNLEIRLSTIHSEVIPHVFVLMPFGKKKGADGTIYDFNAIYYQLIKPAVETAGFEAYRADEESTSGDILADMFQELLLADLCIVDMSIDNANVFYELGVRHAVRKRGIIHIQAGKAYMPFDIFNVPTIPYHTTPEGVPDPAFLDEERAYISHMARETWASDINTIHSPIFNLLNGLVEPDRKSLETPLATGFWREYNEWKVRVTLAKQQKRIGDILLLTEEIRTPLIMEDAIAEAGLALKNLGRYDLALAQFHKGLEVNAKNLHFRKEESFILNRLGRLDEAISKIESIVDDHPHDTESIAYLARLYKEKWMSSWKDATDPEKRLRAALDSCHWLIRSFDTFLRGFLGDLNELYLGMSAVMQGAILAHLAARYDDPDDPDPELRDVREKQLPLRGTLELLLESKAADEDIDHATLICLAELRVLTSKSIWQVSRSYQKAVAGSRGNTLFIQASLDQLKILQLLQLRQEFVQAGTDVLLEELKRTSRGNLVQKENAKPEKEKGESGENTPRQAGMVFLFAGYMVDNPKKKESKFPPEKEEEFRVTIERVLDKYNAGPDELAVTTGMNAGSEIIFVECCVKRGIPVQAYFPVHEAPYVRDFVFPGGEQWVERYYAMCSHPLVDKSYQPDRVGHPKIEDNKFERNNRWALYSSLVHGIDKVRLVALWDANPGEVKDLDARLIQHIVELMHHTGGIVEQINPLK